MISKTKAIIISSDDPEYGNFLVDRLYWDMIRRGYKRYSDVDWTRADRFEATVIDPGFWARLKWRFLSRRVAPSK